MTPPTTPPAIAPELVPEFEDAREVPEGTRTYKGE